MKRKTTATAEPVTALTRKELNALIVAAYTRLAAERRGAWNGPMLANAISDVVLPAIHARGAAGLSHQTRQALAIVRSLAAESEGNTLYRDCQAAEGWSDSTFHQALAEVDRLRGLAPQISPAQLLYSLFSLVVDGENFNYLDLELAGDGSGKLLNTSDDEDEFEDAPDEEEFAAEGEEGEEYDQTFLAWADDASGCTTLGKLLSFIRQGNGLDEINTSSDLETWNVQAPDIGEPDQHAALAEQVIQRFRAWVAESPERSSATLTFNGWGPVTLCAYGYTTVEATSIETAPKLFSRLDRKYAAARRRGRD